MAAMLGEFPQHVKQHKPHGQRAAPVARDDVVQTQSGDASAGAGDSGGIRPENGGNRVVLGEVEGGINLIRYADFRPGASGHRLVEPHVLNECRVLDQPQERGFRRDQPGALLGFGEAVQIPGQEDPVVVDEGRQLLQGRLVKPSTGAVGSSYDNALAESVIGDNALAESVIGLYKTELVKPRRPWKGLDDLEIATAEWLDWFNHRRPFEYCDDLTPVEAEHAHYAHHQDPAIAGSSN